MGSQPDRSSTTKRAIILIPGIERKERGFRGRMLTDNMSTVVQDRSLEIIANVKIDGEVGWSLSARPLRGETADTSNGPDRIDIFEASWSDMMPDISTLSPWSKLWRGLDLLVYWIFIRSFSRKAWSEFLKRPMIGVGLAVGGLILVCWYVSIVLVVTQTLELPSDLGQIPRIEELFNELKGSIDFIRNWWYWLIVAAILRAIPIDEIVSSALTIKDYLENRILDSGEDKRQVGFKDRLRQRIAGTIERVMAADYDEVVVVAHSFGSVLAIDALREWPHESDFDRLKLVTLGSPLIVLYTRSSWLRRELQEILAERRVKRWTDYYSSTDWLCAAVPGHDKAFDNGQSKHLNFQAPWLKRLTGDTHLLYFRNQSVLTELAGEF